MPARGIGNSTVDRLSALARDRGVGLHAALEIAAVEPDILGQGPRHKVAAFCELLKSLRAAQDSLPPADLAEKVLEDSGYRDQLAAENTVEAEGRLENLMELVAQMREYEREAEEPTLADFLERITLASDVDSYDPEKGAVALMTAHTAKGLEFPEVLVVGLEEGVFPHQRSIDDDSAVEEERRLCYVAVTRAMKRLHLCRVRWRRLSGQQLGGVPSRFLGRSAGRGDRPCDHTAAGLPRREDRGRWPLAGSLEPGRVAGAGARACIRPSGARGPAGNHHPALRPRHGARRRGRVGPARGRQVETREIRGGRGARLAVGGRRFQGDGPLRQCGREDGDGEIPAETLISVTPMASARNLRPTGRWSRRPSSAILFVCASCSPQGADPNVRDDEGRAPLHQAVLGNSVGLLGLLLGGQGGRERG